MPKVINFNTPSTSVSDDYQLIKLMARARDEVFEGDNIDFERAYAEAMAQQIVELNAEADDFAVDLADELTDAMYGVLLQWLGEHSACPREDIGLFLATMCRT